MPWNFSDFKSHVSVKVCTVHLFTLTSKRGWVKDATSSAGVRNPVDSEPVGHSPLTIATKGLPNRKPPPDQGACGPWWRSSKGGMFHGAGGERHGKTFMSARVFPALQVKWEWLRLTDQMLLDMFLYIGTQLNQTWWLRFLQRRHFRRLCLTSLYSSEIIFTHSQYFSSVDFSLFLNILKTLVFNH